MTKEEMLSLLRADVVPALGCTEPVAVALCAAYAASVLDGPPRALRVEVNAGIYKNGMSAGIPHCDRVGLENAAAIGAVLQNPEKELELLEDLTEDKLREAMALAESGAVTLELNRRAGELYIKCVISGDGEESCCQIRTAHTNVVLLTHKGEVLRRGAAGESSGENALLEELKEMRLSAMRELVEEASEEELAFLTDGVAMNEELAAYSETQPCGVGLAAALRKHTQTALLGSDLPGRIVTKVAAAAENRLDGCPLPTMSSSGAGTKGLVVILPISETAAVVGASRVHTVRALALGHLINRCVNLHSGRLSPMCTCVLAASTAAAAGIAYLLGGDDEAIGHAVRNMSGSVTGMICDGGKVGCALKVATGSVSALLCALTAVEGAALRASDGICGKTGEESIRNMCRIGARGMENTDGEILSVMLEKKGL